MDGSLYPEANQQELKWTISASIQIRFDLVNFSRIEPQTFALYVQTIKSSRHTVPSQ